ncbi:hypothetical protein EJ06DRAFT_518155 [Trichodelitschia bisporula]|uniref:Uncharacterized protein n=1 Tax=Trichodelitschia bisporula TaxID=703511 RepID=A0A6G1I9Y3_9PEZI|nr:hypothetical protein EJ06DRAFT_518155 [Trichodelitschia bisporula]
MPEDHNWLWRGFQSALFFYISCGPCSAAAYQRKRKKEAMRDRKTKQRAMRMARSETDASHGPPQPAPYEHPAPFEINPHWAEEISLGPSWKGRGQRRGGRESAASRHINTAGTVSTVGSHASSLSDLGPAQSMDDVHLGPHSWARRRYQRPDEEDFWESRSHRPRSRALTAATATTVATTVTDDASASTRPRGASANSHSGSSGSVSVSASGWTVSRPPTASTAATASMPRKPRPSYQQPYFANYHSAPVNDLHPPVVSVPPTRRQDRAWMKEPPPTASFMGGKRGVTVVDGPTPGGGRRRSGSGGSGPGGGKGIERRDTLDSKADRAPQTPKLGATVPAVPKTPSTIKTPPQSGAQTPPCPPTNGTRSTRRRRRPAPLRLDDSSSDESGWSSEQSVTVERGTGVAQRVSIVRPRLSVIKSERLSRSSPTLLGFAGVEENEKDKKEAVADGEKQEAEKA